MNYAFQFAGGARNDTRIGSTSPVATDRKLAEYFWTVTNQGRVGTEFIALSDPIQPASPEHRYRIIEHVEELGGVLIKCASSADPPATLLDPEIPQATA